MQLHQECLLPSATLGTLQACVDDTWCNIRKISERGLSVRARAGHRVGQLRSAQHADGGPPQKSVLWAPWRYYPTHLWSPSNRNLEAVVPSAIYFLAYPSLLTLVAPAIAALRG